MMINRLPPTQPLTTGGTKTPPMRPIGQCMKPECINEPRNTIIIWEPLRREFGSLTFTLEPMDEPNLYKVRTFDKFPHWYLDVWNAPSNDNGERLIRFTRPEGNHTELPSPLLLEVHAAIARAFYGSGMAETIDEILRKRESMRQLAPDGSTDVRQVLPVLLAPHRTL
ncbi:hypothetical protein DTO027B5_3829 [Paecilomyces variotii]|nr:hypothetical protein DTO207G8_2068 [Paecilomyces variotii]KAJ9325801.1 hypothetical protein DTO027B3_3120 [Paecilomyces variotii]KAJ9334347.1 hypothetical protein DTO027B5_3829 [Paecilomyces variotii]KAJ9383804.1 hypothetical protein DTO063F5_5108 [Paecilomyces variotii]